MLPSNISAFWQKGQRKSHPLKNTVQATFPGKSKSVVFCNPASFIFVTSLIL